MDVYATTVGEGAPRLLIHCSLASHEALLPLVHALPPGRNMMFDLPGHGQSGPWDGLGDYQTVTMEAAAGLLDGPTHVIGHSFGGTVALRLALERPDLVSHLSLIEPVLFAAAKGTQAYDAHQAAFAPFVSAWASGDRDRAAQAFIGMWGLGRPWDKMPEAQRADLASKIHLIPATAPAIEEDVHEVAARLCDVQCPVDLIEASDTQPIVGAILDRLEAEISRTTRTKIDGAGHMAPLTHPADVAAAISRE